MSKSHLKARIAGITGVVSGTIVPFLVFAQLPVPTIGTGVPQTSVDTLPEGIASFNAIVNWVALLFWVLVVLFTIFAAFKYLTAQGDPEKVKLARNMAMRPPR